MEGEEEEEDYEEIEDSNNLDLEEYMDNNLMNNNINDIKIENPFYNKILKETRTMVQYLIESQNKFPKIFGKNNFEEALKHLEKISIENTCVCSAVIDTLPAWRCVDCCEYDSAILCSHCYIKSKDFHKNHKVYYLYSSGGMCDCGDPDSLTTFCTEHRGPYSDQIEIDNYISSVFNYELLDQLKVFFDEFFLKFSKYFILTSKCDLFCESTFNEYYNNISKNESNNEKNEAGLLTDKNNILSIKQHFCDLFKKMLDFFRLISNKNLAMFFLLANYFLKNHLNNNNIESKDLDEYKINHPCIKISQNNIEVLYKKEDDNKKMEIEDDNNNKHICECPFLRLLLLNWRDDVKSDKNINEFLLSFARNLPLKRAFCVLFFLIIMN